MSNRPITNYLLLVPAGIIGYFIFMDYSIKQKQQKALQQKQPANIKALSRKFEQCRNIPELTNIYKKIFYFMRGQITEPSSQKIEVQDCEVVEVADGKQTWWMYPYQSRNVMKINEYNKLQNWKQGYYSIFFWLSVLTRQTLVIVNAQSQIKSIQNMLGERQNKCIQIAKKSDPTKNSQFQHVFVQCIRKSQSTVRHIEKELRRVEFIKNIKNYK